MNAPPVLAHLLALIRKNLKVLIRAKASALIIILSPLFIILLAGIAFDNTNLYSVKIGTYSTQYNELSTSFVEQLAQNQFRVSRYPAELACSDALRQGDVHICVVFSDDFTIGKNGSNEMAFYVDNSRLNLVWTVLNVMTARVSERLTALSQNLTTILLSAVEVTQREVASERKAVTKLTTEVDSISTKVNDLAKRYADVDAQFGTNDFGIPDLQVKKTISAQWSQTAYALADEAVLKARSFASEVYDAIDGSSMSSAEKQNLSDKLNVTSGKIEDLRVRIAAASNTTALQTGEMHALLDQVAATITAARDSIAQTAAASTAEGEAVKKSAESALQAIFDIQRSLDAIGASIDAITIRDPGAIVQPVITTIKPIAAQQTYLNYIFPVLIALLVMFTAVLISPTLIMLEKNAPSSFRNFMLPVKESTFVLSIFATCLGILVLQAVIIIAIAAVFFGSVVFSALPVTLLTMLVLTALFTCLGMVVGYLFSSEATATLGAVFSGAALLFLSDVIIPIESMPPFLLAAARYNPFVLGGSILRKTILLAVPLSDIWLDVVILFVEAAALGVAVYFTALRSRRTALRRYFRAQAVPLQQEAKTARTPPAEPPKKRRDRIELRDS